MPKAKVIPLPQKLPMNHRSEGVRALVKVYAQLCREIYERRLEQQLKAS